MNKKSLLAMIAITLFACSSVSAQQFSTISPSDLVSNPTAGQTINVNNVNIGGLLGLNPSDVQVSVSNAVVAQNTNLFAVNDSNSTIFSYSGTAVEAFVQHGQTLGNNFNAATQPVPQDGVSSTTPFALNTSVTTSLNPGYSFGNTANDYFIEYTGPDNANPNQVGSPDAFRFESVGAVSNYTVFSTNNNGNVVNNNYSTGVVVAAAAIPEPSSVVVLALSGLLALRRKRS